MTLVSELGAAQLAIQEAIKQANPSSTKQLFSNKEASGLRRRLATLEEDHKLGKMSTEDYKSQAVDVLKSLEKVGETLSVGEQGLLESHKKKGIAYSEATDSIGELKYVFLCGSFCRGNISYEFFALTSYHF